MNTSPAYAATLLRIALGTMYLAHGLLKLLVFTPEGTAGFFSSLGLPGFFGPVTMALEIAGGVALILGVYARWVAVVLIPVLLGAVILVHGANGWGFGNQGGGWEYPVFLIAASVVQFLLGDGRYAVTQQKTESSAV
ncbi:MAG: DoxX family protein [Oceanospirillales bacterium]|nr:DoxX family protein [Oceanospirillales bacterium]MBR9889925.1 DoxX family protein [Oceanospirillales bacterium]